MTIKTSGFKTTIGMLHDVEAFLKSKEPMKDITEAVKEEIENKTARAMDYQNKPFKSYSEAYAKKKKSTHVDLRLSGKMLGSLKAKVIDANHGRVFIKPRTYPKKGIKTDILAEIHTTGAGKQPQRDFMAISKSALAKIFKKFYDDPLMKILKRRK